MFIYYNKALKVARESQMHRTTRKASAPTELLISVSDSHLFLHLFVDIVDVSDTD